MNNEHDDQFVEALGADVVIPNVERSGALNATEMLATREWFDRRRRHFFRPDKQEGEIAMIFRLDESFVDLMRAYRDGTPVRVVCLCGCNLAKAIGVPFDLCVQNLGHTEQLLTISVGEYIFWSGYPHEISEVES